MVPNFVMWSIVGVVLFIYTVISVILNYHWKRYGKRNKAISLVKRVYFITSGVLIVSAVSILSIATLLS